MSRLTSRSFSCAMTIQFLEDADHREVNVDAQTIGTCNGKDGLVLVARRAARAALAAPTVPCGSAVGLVKSNDEARPNGRDKNAQSQSAVSTLRNAVSAKHTRVPLRKRHP